MTDTKDSVTIEFWHRGSDGAYRRSVADSTPTIESAQGWDAEVRAVGETMLDQSFEGIALVLDDDDPTSNNVLDVLRVRWQVPATPAPELVVE
jgi:uncharacterized protein (DUF934 family)